MVNHQTREELNALSKEVFGASSRWKKLVEEGYLELVTEEVTETVPAEKEGDEPTQKQVKVPVKRADGATTSVVKRHTPDSVKELMLRLKEGRDKYFAAMKKAQEEEQAKKEQEELAKKVQENAGSAL